MGSGGRECGSLLEEPKLSSDFIRHECTNLKSKSSVSHLAVKLDLKCINIEFPCAWLFICLV